MFVAAVCVIFLIISVFFCSCTDPRAAKIKKRVLLSAKRLSNSEIFQKLRGVNNLLGLVATEFFAISRWKSLFDHVIKQVKQDSRFLLFCTICHNLHSR